MVKGGQMCSKRGTCLVKGEHVYVAMGGHVCGKGWARVC